MFDCKWNGCLDRFGSEKDLVDHFHLVHLKSLSETESESNSTPCKDQLSATEQSNNNNNNNNNISDNSGNPDSNKNNKSSSKNSENNNNNNNHQNNNSILSDNPKISFNHQSRNHETQESAQKLQPHGEQRHHQQGKQHQQRQDEQQRELYHNQQYQHRYQQEHQQNRRSSFELFRKSGQNSNQRQQRQGPSGGNQQLQTTTRQQISEFISAPYQYLGQSERERSQQNPHHHEQQEHNFNRLNQDHVTAIPSNSSSLNQFLTKDHLYEHHTHQYSHNNRHRDTNGKGHQSPYNHQDNVIDRRNTSNDGDDVGQELNREHDYSSRGVVASSAASGETFLEHTGHTREIRNRTSAEVRRRPPLATTSASEPSLSELDFRTEISPRYVKSKGGNNPGIARHARKVMRRSSLFSSQDEVVPASVASSSTAVLSSSSPAISTSLSSQRASSGSASKPITIPQRHNNDDNDYSKINILENNKSVHSSGYNSIKTTSAEGKIANNKNNFETENDIDATDTDSDTCRYNVDLLSNRSTNNLIEEICATYNDGQFIYGYSSSSDCENETTDSECDEVRSQNETTENEIFSSLPQDSVLSLGPSKQRRKNTIGSCRELKYYQHVDLSRRLSPSQSRNKHIDGWENSDQWNFTDDNNVSYSENSNDFDGFYKPPSHQRLRHSFSAQPEHTLMATLAKSNSRATFVHRQTSLDAEKCAHIIEVENLRKKSRTPDISQSHDNKAEHLFLAKKHDENVIDGTKNNSNDINNGSGDDKNNQVIKDKSIESIEKSDQQKDEHTHWDGSSMEVDLDEYKKRKVSSPNPTNKMNSVSLSKSSRSQSYDSTSLFKSKNSDPFTDNEFKVTKYNSTDNNYINLDGTDQDDDFSDEESRSDFTINKTDSNRLPSITDTNSTNSNPVFFVKNEKLNEMKNRLHSTQLHSVKNNNNHGPKLQSEPGSISNQIRETSSSNSLHNDINNKRQVKNLTNANSTRHQQQSRDHRHHHQQQRHQELLTYNMQQQKLQYPNTDGSITRRAIPKVYNTYESRKFYTQKKKRFSNNNSSGGGGVNGFPYHHHHFHLHKKSSSTKTGNNVNHEHTPTLAALLSATTTANISQNDDEVNSNSRLTSFSSSAVLARVVKEEKIDRLKRSSFLMRTNNRATEKNNQFQDQQLQSQSAPVFTSQQTPGNPNNDNDDVVVVKNEIEISDGRTQELDTNNLYDFCVNLKVTNLNLDY
eukprot:Awhi_evm1s7831